MRSSSFHDAVRIASLYLLGGGLWIVFSDQALSALVVDPARLTRLQTYKGWGFVLLTAVLLFVLLYRQFRAMAQRDHAIRDSAARLSALFDGANDAIFIIDAASRAIVDANSRSCEMYGYRRDEIIGLDFASLSPGQSPYDRGAIDAWFERARAGEAPTFEWLARRRDGAMFWAEVSTRAYVESAGQRRISALLRDITARRKAAEALRESEQRFATIAHTSPALLWMSERGTDRNWFNEPWLAFTGRGLEDEAGSGWIQGLHPDDREAALVTYFEAFRTESYFRTSYRLRRFDGEFRWLIDEGQPRYNADGDFIGFIGSCLDVTDSRRANDALAESEKRFRSLMEALPNLPVQGYDAHLRVIFWNSASEKHYGYSPDEALGRRFDELLGAGQGSLLAAIASWVASGSAIPAAELAMIRKDGVPVMVHASYVTQANARGEREMFRVDVPRLAPG